MLQWLFSASSSRNSTPTIANNGDDGWELVGTDVAPLVANAKATRVFALSDKIGDSDPRRACVSPASVSASLSAHSALSYSEAVAVTNAHEDLVDAQNNNENEDENEALNSTDSLDDFTDAFRRKVFGKDTHKYVSKKERRRLKKEAAKNKNARA
ncbi:hypothetical protein BC830DRAFT_1135739 [Chytriomyces sp. MP71]|nr:hypothetical protein BC830DRAFT_1135739 [Chytriomyces sp. MP71]